jgi:lysophospholipase L1-like esterase
VQFVSIVVALVAVFFGAVYVRAANDSLWVNTGAIAKTLVAENITSGSPYLDRTCDRIPQRANKYKRIGSAWIRDGYRELMNNCWTKTSYGLFGQGSDGNYIRFGDVGAVSRINLDNGFALPLPQSDKLVRKYSNMLYIFDKLQESYQLAPSGYYDTDTYVRNSNPDSYWYLQDPNTSQPANVGALGYSNNGKWMVMQGGPGYLRLNVETKELLAFASIPGYSWTPGLAVSNDGRYATVSAPGFFRIYDLSTCVPVPDKPFSLATGCGMRDLAQVVSPGSPNTASVLNVDFSEGNQNISYNSIEAGNVMNRYMLTAPGADVHLLEYLALGDSFSSGEGDTDGGRYYVAGTDGNGETINNTGVEGFPYWREKCHQSTRSYPYLLASTAGLNSTQFRSVACSGADLNDILNIKSSGDVDERFNGHFDHMKDLSTGVLSNVKGEAVDNFIPGRAAQIEFVQKYKPRVATIGIGGNDINFGAKLAACIPPTLTCDYASTNRAETADEIAQLYDKLVATYSKLKAASPTTRFYTIGYPQLVTSGGTCDANVLLDDLEREYTVQVVSYLNQTIAAAAAKTGVHYLDINNALAGKNLCSDADEIAVNGLQRGDDKSIRGNDTRYLGFWGNEAYHPNNIGHSLMATALKSDMNNVAIHAFNPCAPSTSLVCSNTLSAKPATPAYFGTSSAPQLVILNGLTTVAGAYVDSIKQGAQMLISGAQSSLKTATAVRFTLHSTPVNLGQATVGQDGTVNATISIPAGTEPGYHTLHMTGTTTGNDTVDFYQNIFVYADETDLDGDGIPNDQDICGPVTESGTDADHDGIDDICDGFVGAVEAHPLYRVRVGDTEQGEVTDRFYIERDVLEAKSKLNIVNDHDPDGDGWALVGHTESPDDGKSKSSFWIDNQNVPHLLLNAMNASTCAQLTPVSLNVVIEGQDRLMKTEQPNWCPEPVADITVGLESPEPIALHKSPQDAEQTIIPIATAAPVPNTAQEPMEPALSPLSTGTIQQGHVAGASTTKQINYFDGPGKNSAEVVGEVQNTFLIGAGIMLAVLLGIVFLVRFMMAIKS